MQEAHILIVDDEKAILQMLETILKREAFKHIDTAATAEDALALCKTKRYDLILLDVMLPNRSGFDICPMIRETTDAPIFFLTARSSDLDKLSGFALGADDYITKPFNPLEVVARIKAHLRRKMVHMTPTSQTTYQYGNIHVNTLSGEVKVNGKMVDLPAQVYQLLLFFCKHPNQLFSKSQLYEQVWGGDFLGEDNTIMVHIRKLREKIEENPSKPSHIITVRGLGYKFVPDGDKHEHS
ncbi:response regulator transcription factor [Siminovitchia sp. FSL H7-0308]|uniref:DNA-binding response OmpR family regulator n=1 Tax=Siminovitchia thermophila TaxID=1245522 RepID=A0ABS2RCK3_9BACI|nr:response regulator transcription factor [Siminovitchia thermophila]MBM7716563.1 DNA-binding response OmpR family regulator [Siminovitchia thermophila]ONK21337.1 DNA-binding response regulator [Bacillus sp. VT-16-64]